MLFRSIIVCVGSRVAWQCADVIDRITRAGSHPDWRFVMSGWLNGDYSQAALAWVTDSSVTLDDVRPLLAARIPVLVPESHATLLQLCRTARCGLFYQSPDDIETCLELLISDTALRAEMGENAFPHTVP